MSVVIHVVFQWWASTSDMMPDSIALYLLIKLLDPFPEVQISQSFECKMHDLRGQAPRDEGCNGQEWTLTID